MIDISCAFPAHPRLGEIARHAEGLGYVRCWTYDSPALYGDVWVACAEIARNTERNLETSADALAEDGEGAVDSDEAIETTTEGAE